MLLLLLLNSARFGRTGSKADGNGDDPDLGRGIGGIGPMRICEGNMSGIRRLRRRKRIEYFRRYRP
jgi:hypothetical protein